MTTASGRNCCVGKLDRARRDYQKMTQIDPTSAVAFNGLAEVNLQAGALHWMRWPPRTKPRNWRPVNGLRCTTSA